MHSRVDLIRANNFRTGYRIRLKVRAFMESEVQPIISDFWERDEFPFDLLPKIRALTIMGLPYKGCPGRSTTMMGFAEAIAQLHQSGALGDGAP